MVVDIYRYIKTVGAGGFPITEQYTRDLQCEDTESGYLKHARSQAVWPEGLDPNEGCENTARLAQFYLLEVQRCKTQNTIIKPQPRRYYRQTTNHGRKEENKTLT